MRCCAGAWCRSRGPPTRTWPSGSTRSAHSPTRWSTASCLRPAPGTRAGPGARHRRRGACHPRELPPVGHRGRLSHRAAGLGPGRRHVLRPGPRLRGNEDPHAQRGAPGHCEPRGDPVRRDRIGVHGAPSDPRPVPQGAARRDRAARQAATGDDAGGLSRPARAPPVEPRHHGHDTARRLRRIVAPPGLRPARPPRRPAGRRTGRGAGPGRGALGAHVRGHTRGRLRHRAERSLLGRAPGRREGGAGASPRLAGAASPLRRLVEAPRFVEAFERWLNRIWSSGCEAAMQTYASA